MMQPELLQASWPLFNIINSTFDQSELYTLDMDTYIDTYINHEYHQFSPSITTTEDTSGGSSTGSYLPAMFSSEFAELPSLGDEKQFNFPPENSASHMEGIENLEFEDVCKWFDESEIEGEVNFPSIWSPSLSTKSSENSMVLPLVNQPLELPESDMELDNQSGLRHLLQAYGEAMEMGQRELAEVIIGSVKERVSQLGEITERVAYNLFQSVETQEEYLKQESAKNFELAFKAFYEIFPYGRFAHFAANSAILEAIPNDAETVHIIDFDMREAVQWAPMIEAIGRTKRALRLTSIRFKEHDCGFDETKRRLFDYARNFGLKMKVEEMGIEELKELKKRDNGREFLAFNCMAGLPHMGARKIKRSHVIEFLNIAKEVLAKYTTKKGVLVFGDGEDGERMKTCPQYGSFFDGHLKHYQSLYESMEMNFPMYLMEARLAMESLFVAPYVSSLVWLQKWEEFRDGCFFKGSEGRRISRDSLMEAKEMVNEGESSYEVKIEGYEENEMVLEWKGVPLVRVSTWM
ncbi:hypothetical protein LguiA_032052 [Lonicera macranthoides]